MRTYVFTKSKSSASDLEKALNNELTDIVSEFVGADITYGDDKNRASILLRVPDDGQGQICQIKIWSNESGDNLSRNITDFLQDENTFSECIPLNISLVYSNGKWRAMLIYYTSRGTGTVDSYEAIAVAGTNADDLDDQISDDLNAHQPILYAYDYGKDKHRGIVVYIRS